MVHSSKEIYNYRFKEMVVSLDSWGLKRATLRVHSLTPGTREIFIPKKEIERRKRVVEAKNALAIVLLFGTFLFLLMS